MNRKKIACAQVTIVSQKDGVDANILDWVQDWNSRKTVVDGNTIITPKIFAGTKNSNGTITGIALGKYKLSTRNASGSIVTEIIEGIYGFYEGFKTFEIQSTGDVILGAGNQSIKYNAPSGKIEFGADVSLNWIGATYINNDGIFTGKLSTTTVNAININASQITAGEIDAERINVDKLKSSLITAGNIEALALNVVKGKIGGWNIGEDNITTGSIGAPGQMPMQIRSASEGWGYWYTGRYKPSGISVTWHQHNNAGHLVFGEIAASGNSVRTGFVGMQMMAWDNTEYFCLSANYSKIGGKEVYNRIAGWAFDNLRIWKNNVSLGADGSIYNGTAWKLNNDGSGQLANGNISWNAAGSVTFSPSVSFNWSNAASSALNTAKSYSDNLINNLQVGGRNLLLNSNFNDGLMHWGTNGGFNTIVEDINFGKIIKTVATGMYQGIYQSPNNRRFSGRLYTFSVFLKADKDMEVMISHEGGIGTMYCTVTNHWKRYIGLGAWYEGGALCFYSQGPGTFYVANPQYEEGNKATIWSPAPEDITTRITQITIEGIYTGTINASQIISGTIHADRIAAGSINSSKLDVNSIKSDIINANYINGLSLTFTSGTIGGWLISTNQISKNSVVFGSDGTISNGTKWRLNTDGSGQFANGNFKWDNNGSISLTGTINATSGRIGGFFISGNKLINSASDSSIEFSTLSESSSLVINGSPSNLISLRADSSRTALSIQTCATGAKGIYCVANNNSTFAIESYGPHQFCQRNGEKWNAPGVLCAGLVNNSDNIVNKWGDGLSIISFVKIYAGFYRLSHNLNHTQYTVIANPYYNGYCQHMNCYIRIEGITSTSFEFRCVDAKTGREADTAFTFTIIGKNVW